MSLDINSHTGPIVLDCVVCQSNRAVIRIVATDADGTVLDTAQVCANRDCIGAVGSELICGTPVKPVLSKGVASC